MGNFYGGVTSSFNILFSMVLLPILEWYLPNKSEKNSGNENDFLPVVILFLLSLLHLFVTLSLIWGIYNHTLTGVYILIASVSSGINAGTNGIVVAHELIHRKELFLKIIGIVNLTQVNYGHFYIEHIKGHHKYVGTGADPATAKFNESLYQFILRTVPGQLISAFHIEQKRLYDKNINQLRNFVVFITSVEVLGMLFLYLVFGLKVLFGILIYSAVAIFLLEYVNYIEHYGLVRDEAKKFEAQHAWQSNKITSRLGLIELSRHADHHLKASKPYHTLNSHEGYFLPSGYYGMFYIAVFPKWWFKTIHPIINANKNKFD